MLSTHGRVITTPLFTPVARALLRLRLGPDSVSLIGTAGTVVAALWFLPQGSFIAGPLLIAAFALSDTVDGLMARELEARGVVRSKEFGAFLDSTLDRVADGAVFGGLVLWFAGAGASAVDTSLALLCLVLGSVVPYARARAESLGLSAAGGIAERADRLVAVLIAILLLGLGAPGWVMTVILGALAAASAVTVCQRVLSVRRQALAGLRRSPATDTAATSPVPSVFPARITLLPRHWGSSATSRRREPREPWLVRNREAREPWLSRRERRRPARPRSGR